MNGKGDENVLFREQLNDKNDRCKILKSSQITMIKWKLGQSMHKCFYTVECGCVLHVKRSIN